MDKQELALRVEGLTFVVGVDEEPRIKDLDFAERLGFDRPRKVRDMIRRYQKDGNLNDSDICPTVGRSRSDGKGRPATEYHLNERAALFLAAKSETENGNAILGAMISLWLAVRRQHAQATQPQITALLARVADMERLITERSHVDSRGIIFNDPARRRELRNLIANAADACGVRFIAIEGVIREDFDVPGYLSLPLRDLPAVREKLTRFIEGSLTFIVGRQRRAARRARMGRLRRPAASKKQLKLIPLRPEKPVA